MRINFTEVGARLRVELLLTKRSKSSLSNIILKSGVAPNTLKCTEINTNKTFVIETSVITKAINKGVSSRQNDYICYMDAKSISMSSRYRHLPAIFKTYLVLLTLIF